MSTLSGETQMGALMVVVVAVVLLVARPHCGLAHKLM